MTQSKQYNSTLIQHMLMRDYGIGSRYFGFVFYGGIELPSEEELQRALPAGFDSTTRYGFDSKGLNDALESLGATRLASHTNFTNPRILREDRSIHLPTQGPSTETYTHHADGLAKFVVITSGFYPDPLNTLEEYMRFAFLASIGDLDSDKDIKMLPSAATASSSNQIPHSDVFIQITDDFDAEPNIKDTLNITKVSSDFKNVVGFDNGRVADNNYFTVHDNLVMEAELDQVFEFSVAQDFDLIFIARKEFDGFDVIRTADNATLNVTLQDMVRKRVGLPAGTYQLKSKGNNTLTQFKAEVNPLSLDMAAI